jgi:hypothetical protein
MAFNSSALTAGIGSMLQGMQQSAQQKLQLAQMERQQRIEHENLAQQRAMEKIALEGAGVDLGQKKAINPLQLRDLTARVDLTEKMSPFQLESAKVGVEGQKLGNRQSLFQLDKVNPLLERQQTAATELAEKTLPTNIKLAEQTVQGNQFNFLDKAKARYQGAAAGLKTAQSILNNPQATGPDRALAFKEYNTNAAILRGATGDINSMANLSSLFGDRAAITTAVRSALNVPASITDDQLDSYIQSVSPDMKAPSPADNPERFQQILNMVSQRLNPMALTPESSFVDYTPGKLVKGKIVGGNVPAKLNTTKLAEKALPGFLTDMKAAKGLGYDAKTVWNTIGTFTDKDFDPKTGDLNIADPGIKRRAIAALATNFKATEKQQDALMKFENTSSEALKLDVQMAIANMNKQLGIKQSDTALKAALASTTVPLVNVWTDAYTKASGELTKLSDALRGMNAFDAKGALLPAFIDKIKKAKDSADKQYTLATIKRYQDVKGALNSALTSFVKTGVADNIRVARSLRAFASINITPDGQIPPGLDTQAGGTQAPAPDPNAAYGIQGGDGMRGGFDSITLPGGARRPVP